MAAPVPYTVCTFGQPLRIVTGRCSVFYCMWSSMVMYLDTAVRRADVVSPTLLCALCIIWIWVPGIKDIEE